MNTSLANVCSCLSRMSTPRIAALSIQQVAPPCSGPIEVVCRIDKSLSGGSGIKSRGVQIGFIIGFSFFLLSMHISI